MKKLLFAMSFVLLLLAGCLEIDGQELAIHYDAGADRIDVHVVYRGLFAEGGSGSERDPLAKARKDLAEAKQSGEFAFWCNWPMALDLTREFPAPVRAMLDHLDIENGALFTDPQGVLCAQQFVRIREAKAFVQKLNLVFELWAQAQLLGGTSGRDGKHAWDADTKDLVREFLRSGEKLLVVEPGRLQARLPLSTADHQWLKRQLELVFLDNMPRETVRRLAVAERRAGGGDPADTAAAEAAVVIGGEQLKKQVQQAPSFRFFWDNELAVVREPELTCVSFGVRDDKVLRVRKSAGGLYHPQLLDALREAGEAIEDGMPDQELERRFEAFRQRDAVLPPKLAALRAGKGAEGK